MNNTNRGLNRLFVVIVGVILFAVGLGAVAVGSIPMVSDAWKSTAPTVRKNVASVFRSLTVGGIEWGLIGVIAVLVIIVALLVAFIFRQGHGHTLRFVRDDATEDGSTIIDSRVAEQAVQQALDSRQELVASHVSTYLVKGTPVLKVSATAQRGVSPSEIVNEIETMIVALEKIIGRPVPTSIQVGGGFRSRTTGATRLR
jgi:hypothetical protein